MPIYACHHSEYYWDYNLLIVSLVLDSGIIYCCFINDKLCEQTRLIVFPNFFVPLYTLFLSSSFDILLGVSRMLKQSETKDGQLEKLEM